MAAPETTPHPELQYLNLVRSIVAKGTRKSDRTGEQVISLVLSFLMKKMLFWCARTNEEIAMLLCA